MPKQPKVRIVRDDGLGDSNPTFLIDGGDWSLLQDGMEGFDAIEHTVSVGDYAQFDGGYLLAERTGTVDRTITAASRFLRIGREAARDEAESFFIPGRAYEVHVSYGGHERWCAGRQYALSLPLAPAGETQKLTWTVLCLDPYLMSEDEKSADLVEASKRRGFPFASPAGRTAPGGKEPAHVAGFVVGVIQNRVSMRNDGHAVAYPRFDMSARGTVENPSVKVLDAAGGSVCSIGLDLTLADGDALVVDFTARPTAITLNGENVSSKVTRGSTLAAGIPVGAFTVEWSAESGDAALSVVPTIRERYTCI